MPTNNDLLTKSFHSDAVSSSRPLSMSSQELDNMGGESSPYDIAMLEKDSELLARKAAKRFKNNYATQSESFVEKIISWHRKKKVDKIKTSLESLFPKLKDSESAVKIWLTSVSEKKEEAWVHGSALLADMDAQISVYQQHLDFLDEVVNDIRQIDYDLLREVSELRVAFAFNQEVLMRASPRVATPSPSSFTVTSKPAEVGGGKVFTVVLSSSPHNQDPSRIVGGTGSVVAANALSAAMGQESETGSITPLPPSHDAQITVLSEAGVSNSVDAMTDDGLCLGGQTTKGEHAAGSSVIDLISLRDSSHPACGNGAKPSDAAGLTQKLLEINAADGATDVISARGQRSSQQASAGETRRPLSTGSKQAMPASTDTPQLSPRHSHRRVASSPSNVAVRGAPVDCGDPSSSSSLLVWDGEESKRKSLTVSCVPLQSLKLGTNNTAVASPTAVKSGGVWKLGGGAGSNKSKGNSSSSSSSFLSSPFGVRSRSNTAGSGGSDGSDPSRARRLSWSKKEGVAASATLAVPASSPGWSSLSASPRTPYSSSARQGPPPQSSSDESSCASSSHSDGEGSEEAGSARNHPNRPSSQGRSGTDSIKPPLSNKLSLHKLLAKGDNRVSAADQLSQCDPDQREMGARIQKCLALKDTLKSVLKTVQSTQDAETSALRKMKKLRAELRAVCPAESDSAALHSAAKSSVPYHSLNDRSPLLLALQGSGSSSGYNHVSRCGYSSGANSRVSSTSSLQYLGRAAGYGSESSEDYSTSHGQPGGSSGGNSLRTMDRLDCATPRSRPSDLSCGDRRSSSSPAHSSTHIGNHVVVSASIPIIVPSSAEQNPEEVGGSAAAYSFVTTATTGSDDGRPAQVGDSATLKPAEDRLSIGSRGSSVFGEGSCHPQDVQEAAMECVDGLKSLLQQESEARQKLAKLVSLIDSATSINDQLRLNAIPPLPTTSSAQQAPGNDTTGRCN